MRIHRCHTCKTNWAVRGARLACIICEPKHFTEIEREEFAAENPELLADVRFRLSQLPLPFAD